jgi:hypothetical protein
MHATQVNFCALQLFAEAAGGFALLSVSSSTALLTDTTNHVASRMLVVPLTACFCC